MLKTIIDFDIKSLNQNSRNEVKELLKEKFTNHFKSFSTKNTKDGFTATMLTDLHSDAEIEHPNDFKSFLCSFKYRYKPEIKNVIIEKRLYNDEGIMIQSGPKVTIFYVA